MILFYDLIVSSYQFSLYGFSSPVQGNAHSKVLNADNTVHGI